MHPTYTTNHTEDFEQEPNQFIIQSFINYIKQQDPNQLNPNFEQELKQFMKYLNQKNTRTCPLRQKRTKPLMNVSIHFTNQTGGNSLMELIKHPILPEINECIAQSIHHYYRANEIGSFTREYLKHEMFKNM